MQVRMCGLFASVMGLMVAGYAAVGSAGGANAVTSRPAASQAAPVAARVLFLGLWDRAFEQMARAAAETGVRVEVQRITVGDTPGTVDADMEKRDYTQFDLIYILQIDVAEAHILAGRLKQAKAVKPSLRVVQLDRRTSQQELIDEGIMEVDPRATAYWRGFGLENLKRLLGYSRVKYLGESGEVADPVPAAVSGLYHPDATGLFRSWPEYEAWSKARSGYRADGPLVAVFIQQDYVIYGNSRVYDTLVRALESRGVRVAAMFGGSQELQALVRECRPALLMLQHHSGPEDSPPPGQTPFLEQMGVPYLYSAGMMSSITVKQWEEDIRGIKLGGYAQLSRHELYGIIEPFLIGAKGTSPYGFALDEPIPERVNRFAERVQGWLDLQRTPKAEKKVAIIYFHKYLGKADIGRPAAEMSRYLDPHESLVTLLKAMGQAGYRVSPMPGSSEELLGWMKRRGRNIPSWAPGEMDELLREGDPVLIPEKRYLDWYQHKLSSKARAAVEAQHGAAPGKLMVTERSGARFMVIPCIQLGNVVLAPQPDRGTIQDGDLVHSRTAAPPHNYLAFYWWLEEEFGAKAMVHFGTHGSDFYLPGKEFFLSGDCFPDAIVGAMPNFYVWTIQNVGEAVIAKRRSYAVIVDHGVPPILAVSRDAQVEKLIELLDRLHSATAPPMKEAIRRELSDSLRASGLMGELKLSLKDGDMLMDAQIDDLSTYLQHLSGNNVVQGMHVLGVPPTDEKALPFVEHIVARNSELTGKLQAAGVKGDVDATARNLLELLLIKKVPPADAARQSGLPESLVTEQLVAEIAMARQAWDGLKRTGDEITNLLAGLDGKYVPPGPGGDPILRPDALPTGRNLYGLSPLEIPTRQAWDLARKMTDEFLAKFKTENGRYPAKLAFSMTGMETFRDMGVMEAQIMYLLGIRPEWSPGRLISGLKAIPREELGRPRVDVVMSVNGIYLKDFPSTVRLLDEAVRLAGACDEPDNAVRLHAAKIEGELRGGGVAPERARELSMARAFGSTPGGGGARLIWFLPRSGTWDQRQEIVELWRTMRTHAYTGNLWGEQLPELHDKVFAGTEGIISNWSDNLLGPLTNHHYPEETGGLALSVQWINGKKSDISIFDLRQKAKPGAIGLEEVLSMELRSVALNRQWIQGQMDHGYIGATQFMQIVDDMFQWEAVREGAIWPGAWDQVVDAYVRDKMGLGMREFFDRANPFAFQELTATLLEASRKGYWVADPATVREVALAHAQSIARFGHGAGPYAGGNTKLRGVVTTTLNRAGDDALRKTYLDKIGQAEQARAAAQPQAEASPAAADPVKQQVAGKKMEQKIDQGPAPASPRNRAWMVFGGMGLAVLVLLAIGFRFSLGVPPGR